MLPLTEGEQNTLIEIARHAIEACVLGGRQTPAEWRSSSASSLSQPCGAFVTLRRRGALRGCIGHVEAERPLAEAVAECAAAACARDPRFPPVALDELPDLQVEISVLSPLFDILPSEVEIGRHGLLISQGWQRGLLLPQVAVEWKWERGRFLEETCRKAGLPPDAWQRGARIQAFTTQTFTAPREVSHLASARATPGRARL